MGRRDRPVMEIVFGAEPRMVPVVRRRLEEFLQEWEPTPEQLEELKVALSEACSNAVCHGSPRGQASAVEVRFEIDGQRLVISITDEGRGFQPQAFKLPEYEEWKPSGRGLFLMKELMDEVQFDPLPRGTRVRLVKRLESLQAQSQNVMSRSSGPAKLMALDAA
jgi:serine/threonine-protein kinase RsbW